MVRLAHRHSTSSDLCFPSSGPREERACLGIEREHGSGLDEEDMESRDDKDIEFIGMMLLSTSHSGIK